MIDEKLYFIRNLYLKISYIFPAFLRLKKVIGRLEKCIRITIKPVGRIRKKHTIYVYIINTYTYVNVD